MKILFLCGRELNYTRNQVLLTAFRQFASVDVIAETGEPGSILRRSLMVTLRAIPKLITKKYDLVLVGFYGYLIMMPIRLMTKSPIIFDAFISTYDTFEDRRMIKKSSFAALLPFWLDKISCRLANRILLDTSSHVDYFVRTFGLSPEKFSVVPVGCDEQIFSPKNIDPVRNGSYVLFYCTYLPLHGVDFVIQAAAQLKNNGIQFHLIGNGKEFDNAYRLASSLKADNITFLPPMSLQEIAKEITNASICLGGHFGTSEKAKRVVAGKTYQCIAMAKPVIVGDNPANQEFLSHGQNAWFCQMGNADALVHAIKTLDGDEILRTRLGNNARLTFLAKAGTEIINCQIENMVDQLLKKTARQ